MFSFLSRVESARVFPPFSRAFPPRKIDTFLRKVEQNQPRRYEIQNWPQESKHDHFQLLHKKSALRAEILQTDKYLCPFEDYIYKYAYHILYNMCLSYIYTHIVHIYIYIFTERPLMGEWFLL